MAGEKSSSKEKQRQAILGFVEALIASLSTTPEKSLRFNALS